MQSVAVRMITEREREIQAFVPVEYWSLHARLRAEALPEFEATLREVRGQKANLPNEADTLAVVTGLHGADWRVKSVTKGERKRNPAAPFITSTLQQEGGRRLHFTAKRTMMLAQQLYEGIELGAEGSVGLITYMRTDAVRVSQEAQAEAREWVTARLGAELLPPTPPTYTRQEERAGGARGDPPVERRPGPAERRAVPDQGPARALPRDLGALRRQPDAAGHLRHHHRRRQAGECVFRAQGSTLRFAGFTAVYVESREESEQPPEEESEAVLPPLDRGRAAQASLAGPQAALHPAAAPLHRGLAGQGARGARHRAAVDLRPDPLDDPGPRLRPAATAARCFPTELGMQVTDMLVPHFPEVMDVEFTAQLEESLDKIEEGDADWVETVAAFYKEFAKDLTRAGRKMEDYKEGVKTGEACPDCAKPLVEKWGRFGKFLACSAYPDCKFTKDLGGGRERPPDEPWDESCPTCGKPMVVKHGRFGKFIACSGYPECKTTKPVPLGIGCPQEGCGGQLVERRSKRGKTFYACANYPKCTYSLWQRPIAEPCPTCGAPFITERFARGGKTTRACVREGCGYKAELTPALA